MQIQEEAPRPANPLATFDEDYEKAVLHLAWDRHAGTKERTLLFAMVELLPIEVPPPLDDGEQSERLGGKSEHHVYLRRVVMSARQALGWYLECRRGVAVLPEEDGSILGVEAGGRKLELADLGEEPPWPTLVCVSGESNTTPFCPAWHQHPRVHHLVPLSEMRLEKLWVREAEREKATRWLTDRLHFELEEYPEYWGSVHLVAPNPVYRKLRTRLQPRTPPKESVLLQFQPRAGKSVEGLELTFTEKEPWGLLDVRHVVVKRPLIRLDFDRKVTATKQDVYDRKRGVLAPSYHETVFLRSIAIGMQLVTGQVRVEGKKPGASYEVRRVSKPETSIIGDDGPKAPSAGPRMLEVQRARKKRSDAKLRDQRWFSGQQEEAAEVLRSIIHAARRDVLLVDPYFGPDELYTFSLAVAQEDVPIQILSSAKYLKSKKTKDGKPLPRGPGEELLENLEHIAKHARMNPIEIRVMKGKRSSIHDRFLLVDGRVWLIGSSLNEFGARGTMMVTLPEPHSVRQHLLKAWDAAMDLKVWVEEEHRKRQAITASGAQ